MTLFLIGLFLLIAASTVGYWWRRYGGMLLAFRPRIEVFDPAKTSGELNQCGRCNAAYTFTPGEEMAAWERHQYECPGRRVTR